MTKKSAPYGTWTSPISADLVAGQSLRFDLVQYAAGTVYWTETRPAEGGRSVVVACRDDGGVSDVTPDPFSARTKVHEYGGGAYLACDDKVFFVNDGDQSVYRVQGGGAPVRIAGEEHVRFGDLGLDPSGSRLVCVAEQHEDDPNEAPENFLAEIALEGSAAGTVELLVGGCDFYANPRFSPDGTQMCWIEWDLPWMPWESSRLMVGVIAADGGMERMSHVAGGDGHSVFQPTWGTNGQLYFSSDRTGWGNLYVWDGAKVEAVAPLDAEFARPLWGLATTSFVLSSDNTLVASFIDDGVFKLGEIGGADGEVKPIPHPYRQFDSICATDDGLAALVTGDVMPPSIVRMPVRDGVAASPLILRQAMNAELDSANISTGRLVEIPLDDGNAVHAIYYPPTNSAFDGEAGTAPPLIAAAHGGPTGMADRGLKLKIQYWTSRGFAFVDVDYRGSAGYGTAYRDALNGQWGLRDVDDVIAATEWLVGEGLADGKRRLISGGSAGGFTVLCALTFHDVFAAGASYYGIGDLQKLLDLTHKFESGYIYNLTGTSLGQTEAVFQARSPLHHAEQISSPAIFFQGIEDKVVPPGQSRTMVEALKRQGVPVAYLEFEGEGHGFRRAETIVAALNAEYAFYARVLGLEPQEALPAISIFNEERL